MKENRLKPFGSVWGASGVQNFDGKGYPFHRILKFFGLWFVGVTFVAKTTSWLARLNPEKKEGNMPLKEDGMTPKEWMPKCVHLTFMMWIQGMVLNAIGLSGPGAPALFDKGIWDKQRKAFMISFMSVAKTRKERLEEFKKFIDLLKSKMEDFKVPIALQINFSCPNTGHNLSELIYEVMEFLNYITESNIGIQVVMKFNVELPIDKALIISRHRACSGICMSNTIPFGKVLSPEWWHQHFGALTPADSPLDEFGGGGLSGKPLLNLVIDWIKKARAAGITCHINACGGILGPIDAIRCLLAGADSISLGSIALLRPWMMVPTILATKAARPFVERPWLKED